MNRLTLCRVSRVRQRSAPIGTGMNDNLWGWTDQEWVDFGREVEAEVAEMPQPEDAIAELERLLGVTLREGEQQ